MFSLVIQVVFIGGVLSSETALDSHPTLLSSIADVGNYDPLLIIPRRQLPAMMRWAQPVVEEIVARPIRLQYHQIYV